MDTSNLDAVDRMLINERNGYSSWDKDYKPTPEVIALVNQVFDYIEANPESWNQHDYGSAVSDKNCFFGLMIRISGIDPYEDGLGYYGFGIATGMMLLGMGTTFGERKDYYDRAEYIAYFRSSFCDTQPTLDEMREHVSFALSHDFRKDQECRCPALLDCECNN